MNYGMTIRAHRAQVLHWIDLVVLPNLGQRPKMVDAITIEAIAVTTTRMITVTGTPNGRAR